MYNKNIYNLKGDLKSDDAQITLITKIFRKILDLNLNKLISEMRKLDILHFNIGLKAFILGFLKQFFSAN